MGRAMRSTVVPAFMDAAGRKRSRWSTDRPLRVLEAMHSLHVVSCFDDHLNAFRSLIVDTATADGLCKIMQHGPWCARQVAQEAVLSLASVWDRHGHVSNWQTVKTQNQ